MKFVKTRTSLKVAALSAVIAVVAPVAALADKNAALSACAMKAEETYGDGAITKLKRIKKRGDYKVQLFVTGVSESRFVAECVVSKDNGEVTSLEPATAP